MFQITVVAANVVMVAAASGDAVRNLKPHTCHQILVNFVVIIISFSVVIVFGLSLLPSLILNHTSSLGGKLLLPNYQYELTP